MYTASGFSCIQGLLRLAPNYYILCRVPAVFIVLLEYLHPCMCT